MFTTTAIPSIAIVLDVTSVFSSSFRSLEAIPISTTPCDADVTPVVESDSCTDTVTPVFSPCYASASFSITGGTEEEPPTVSVPVSPDAE